MKKTRFLAVGILTRGLGRHRILRDPRVIRRAARFLTHVRRNPELPGRTSERRATG